MEDNESSQFEKFQKALEDGSVTDEEKAEFRAHGLLGRLAHDIGNVFDQSVFENLKAEYEPVDTRFPAKYHVVIHVPPAAPAREQDVEYFSPALNAYACFKSSKNEPNSEAENCFFEAGIAYFFEWKERKKSAAAGLGRNLHGSAKGGEATKEKAKKRRDELGRAISDYIKNNHTAIASGAPGVVSYLKVKNCTFGYTDNTLLVYVEKEIAEIKKNAKASANLNTDS